MKNKLLAMYGFCEVYQTAADVIMFTYGGNMGARLRFEVRECVDALISQGAFSYFYAHKIAETGSPDYAWSMTVPKYFVVKWIKKHPTACRTGTWKLDLINQSE